MLLAAVPILLALPLLTEPAPPVALVHVTVIDEVPSASRTDMTVIVADGHIAAVGKSASLAVAEGTRVIDGTGTFLIPGLCDMHVHLSWTSESALPALLANGITTVRDMGGMLDEIDRWRAEIAAGVRPGPRILRAGPTVNGAEAASHHLKVSSPEEARIVVRTLKKVGVDFIKVHNALPREAYLALAEEAALQKIAFVGHIPRTVAPIEACRAGQASIEHTETLFEGTFAKDLRPEQLPDAIARFVREDAQALIDAMVESGTFFTPMLVAYRNNARPLVADVRDQFVAHSVRVQGEQRSIAPQVAALRQNVLTAFIDLVHKIHSAGVPVLAGTDLASAGLYPGFSLHDELALLVQAGLTPLEALQSATSHPARLMAQAGWSGTIEPGTIADLVLLDADPSVDIRNVARIRAVIAAGRLHDRADLDALLRQAATAAATH